MRKRDVQRLLMKAQKICGGSGRKFAAAVGVAQPSIWNAMRIGHVSAELATDIHIATNGQVPRWELRPDMFEPGQNPPVGMEEEDDNDAA
jgi:DNA-binding transcriptional regulator YdaS (Cro superfamily)